jgi:hypothetical protein
MGLLPCTYCSISAVGLMDQQAGVLRPLIRLSGPPVGEVLPVKLPVYRVPRTCMGIH